MGIGGILLTALVAVLERPSTWVLGLAAFLARGGWLIVLAPIVVLPTAVGLANVVAPLLEDVAFGRRTEEVVTVASVTLAIGLGWLIGGGLVAAAAEVEGVRRTSEAMGGASVPSRPSHHAVVRVLAVRLTALVPLVLALVWGSYRFVMVGYRELTVPSDVATPAAYRILAGAPDAVLACLLTWLFADIVGAVAARRVILADAGVRRALRGALGDVRREPFRLTALASVSVLVLLGVVGLTAAATGTAWDGLRAALANGDASVGTTVLLVLFVGLFVGSLVLLALSAAWRSATWTVEAARRSRAAVAGTFGGGGETRSGD